LARFSKDLFVDAAKRGWLARFWLKRGRIRDMGDLTDSKGDSVGDFFCKGGSIGFWGVYWFILNVGQVSGVMRWPSANTNALLVSGRDF
jgi:hypothetical protein